jgi:predicted ferric reductase
MRNEIRLSIKALGDYSSWIRSVSQGSNVFLEGPYGRFSYYFNPARSYVWIAGGIGITPFVSMAYTLTGVTPVDVYYCASNAGETAHLDELQELEQTTGNFRVIPWYSEEKGRLSASIEEGLADRWQIRSFLSVDRLR